MQRGLQWAVNSQRSQWLFLLQLGRITPCYRLGGISRLSHYSLEAATLRPSFLSPQRHPLAWKSFWFVRWFYLKCIYILSFKILSPEAPDCSGSLETRRVRLRKSRPVVGTDSQERFSGVLFFSGETRRVHSCHTCLSLCRKENSQRGLPVISQ